MGFNLYLAGSYSKMVDEKLQEMGVNRLASQLNDRSLLERWITYIKEVEHRKLFVDFIAFHYDFRSVRRETVYSRRVGRNREFRERFRL